MQKKNHQITKRLTCEIPRKKEAIEALLSLAWKKTKKERPAWVLSELSSIL